VVVRPARGALAREEAEGIVLLVRHEHVAPARAGRVNRDAFAILGEAVAAEDRELIIGVVRRRIRVVLAEAEVLVAVVDEAEFQVDREGLDLLLPAPSPKARVNTARTVPVPSSISRYWCR
jgi:hypothetical protein